ncbi:hypothetical protein ABEV74_06000 [Paenibacillus cisolokensis]|uniref:hypothetical protein n=1 Tax=Paenibacillus cisolokensis TaxID=1658519 RepID=UPI003D293DA3
MQAEVSINRPIVQLSAAVLLLLAVRMILPWDEGLGMTAFFALLIPFFFLLRWPHTPGALFTGLCVLMLGKLVYAMTTDPLAGPDEIHYYEQVVEFERLGDFLPYAWEHIVTQWHNISAYPMFGLLYMPFFKWMEIEGPLPIILLNTVLLILTVNQTYRLNANYFRYALPGRRTGGIGGDAGETGEPSLRFHAIVIFGLLVSPSLMYMSSLFAKDVTCVLLGVYGAALLLRKKYVWFVVVLLYATGLRDYAIVYTVCFWLLYTQRFRTAIAVMMAALGILVVQIGPTALVNTAMLTVFLFVSPNPANLANWSPELLLRTLEAVWMSIWVGVSALLFMRYRETRKFYAIAFVLLFIYAATLVLVGYVTITGRELEYGVGTIGDNMVRKKLPILPLVYTMNAYTLLWFFRWCRDSLASRAGKRPVRTWKADSPGT